MRRVFAFVLGSLLVAVSVVAYSRPVAAQKPQRVELPEGTVLSPGSRPVLSQDGSVGIVAPAVGDTIIAFAVRTGEVLGRLEGLGNATAVALDDNGTHRIALLTYSEAGDASAVAIVDVTDPSAMSATAFFRLAEGLKIAPGVRAEVARGQTLGIVAVSAPVPALVSFDLQTGEQVGALTLDGVPDGLTVLDRGDAAVVAISSSATNKVAVMSLSDAGVLMPLSTFVAPTDAPLSSVNNVVFDAAGKVGYVASLRGRALFSFSVETGDVVDRLDTEGSSAAVTVYHAADKELIAVTNVSRPGGAADDDVAPKADEPPLGIPGAVLASSDATGKLAERSRFFPDTGEEIVPTNNAEFSADGATVYVPARTGSLYVVDAATGRSVAREGLDNRIQSIAAAPLAEAVAVLSAGGSEGHIDIVPTARVEAPTPGDESAAETKPETRERERDKTDAVPPSITRLGPSVVQSGRRSDLPVSVVGSGFADGAVVVVGDTVFAAAVGPNGRRANFTLSASFLASPGLVPVAVRNPDGSVSNVVNLEVVVPFAPVITRVRPKQIFSTDDGVDVTVVGDHFRDGAVAKVTYTDRDGTTKTEDLKTYRLSFTTVVARMPRKFVLRAQKYALTVTDRDGVTVSEPADLAVVGPSIASVTPERVVAGEFGQSEALALKVVGENFHRDALVYVKRPTRNANDDAPFVQVPSGNVRWKSGERLVVTLAGADAAYAGNLIVRVVNPVRGEKRKNGDVAETTVTVAGPVVATTSPDVVVAGTEAFILKLTGTDFRRSAVVKISRDGGGQGQRRAVVVDDPNFKDRKQINVEVSSDDLLRLVARPGTLQVKVINGNGASGAPSPSVTVQVVAPGILAPPELIPSTVNPAAYRLKITGQYFRAGAVVQIYDASGNPVGKPIDARVKGADEIVVLIGRERVTELRTFKVVVINPGGPFNSDGIPSNPADVTVN
jgi:hypothetical protein